MAARVPPPIAIQDLDRDELLELLARHAFIAAQFTPYDLLSARWDVAVRRATEARAAEQPFSEAYWNRAGGVDPTTMSQRAYGALVKDREAKRLAYEAARRRTRRAEAAEERAWKALDTHSNRRAPA